MTRSSPFFQRIKRDVLTIAAAIPHGRLASFSEIGQWLDVVPRHVAYILSQLAPEEQAQVPWHRVVPADGVLARPKMNAFGMSQRELLRDEGVKVSDDGVIDGLKNRLMPIPELKIDLPRQKRPTGAPVASRRKAK